MKIKELLSGIDILSISGDALIDISGLSYDSRKVEKGHVFVAIQGEKSDGHDFIDDAISRGAKAVVFEKAAVACMPSARTFVHVKDSRKALALASGNFFGMPSKKMNVIGVTGTNGKTTTTYIIKSILEAWDKKVGLIGTIRHMIQDEVFEALHTTPEAFEFQGLLHRMKESGCTYVVSEVSSHALAQKRVDGSVFKSGIFTNLTRDHLDFHKTMDRYFAAKKRLFTEMLDKNAISVINYDDIWGRKLISILLGNVYSYGLEAGCDIRAAEIDNSFEGLRFKIIMRGRKYSVVSGLTGLPNVYNIMSAAGAAVSLGVPWDIILEGIKNSGSVPGRFEKVDAGQGFLAVVDYAHTEDALERLIYTAKGMAKGKIITLFGCGGDRDRGKRPKMGSIATRLSDHVIMTSDNPRSEDPENIIREIEAGAMRKNYLVEPDRREAIKRAVMMASEGDVLLVAGKGHENYQEIKGTKYKFSDREVLEETIKQLAKNS
jgi:UDP-N-acetylmuramoyl-L-alanyl-D-glutamate--2,6-diaminopimelate ligase